MRWALPTARDLVVLKDGLAPWTTREWRRNVQEKQSPALPGLKSINQVLTGEVLGICYAALAEELGFGICKISAIKSADINAMAPE